MAELVATARRLHAVRTLSVKTLKRAHPRTSTDRIAGACRSVKAEASGARPQRNAVLTPSAARRTARRPAPVPPRARRRDTVVRRRDNAPRAFQNGRLAGPDQRTEQHGARDALLIALRGQDMRSLSTGVQAMREALTKLLARVGAFKERLPGELPLQLAQAISVPRAFCLHVWQLLRRCAVGTAHRLRPKPAR